MAKPTPQYLQLSNLLDFLYESLRADTALQALMCTDQVSPDENEVCRKYLEHDPFEISPEQGGPQLSLIYGQEIPVLAAWEESSESVKLGKVWGERAKITLLYLFETHLGNASVTPKAWNARLSKIVSWRICGYIRKHTLTDWETTGDLLTDGFIRNVTTGRITRLTSREYEGFSMDLTMEHSYPPYSIDAAGDFLTIDLEVHEDDEIPATSGVILEATLDATPES